jgi:hypothetical protein
MSVVALISVRDHVVTLLRWPHRLALASRDDLVVLVFDAGVRRDRPALR